MQSQEVKVAFAKQGTTVQMEGQMASVKGNHRRIHRPRNGSRSLATCRRWEANPMLDGASGKVKSLSRGIRKDMMAFTCSSTDDTYGS